MPGILTTCPFCGCGCGLILQTDDEKLSGVTPSLVHPISQGRLCNRGWHAYERSLNPDRLRKPLVRRSGKLVEATWTQALEAAAEGLREIKEKHGPEALAVLGSPACTNEANFALMRLARQALGTNNVDFSSRLDLSAVSGVHSTATIESIDDADLILMVGVDSGEEHPAITARVVRARKRGATLLTISRRHHRMARLAALHLQPLATRTAEALAGLVAGLIEQGADQVPADLKLDGLTLEQAAASAGLSVDDVTRAAQLFHTAKKPVVIIGKGVLRNARGDTLIAVIDKLLAVGTALGQEPLGTAAGQSAPAVLTMGARSNSRGAHEMGLDPDLLTGYQPVDDANTRQAFESAWNCKLPTQKGLSLSQMAGKVRGLILLNDNPLFFAHNQKKVKELFDNLEFLVLIDSNKGELLDKANIALPAAAFGEEEGTATNMEGRVQRLRVALPPISEAKETWEAVNLLARHLGADFGYRNPAAVMEQIAKLTPLYADINYAALDAAPGQLLPPPATKDAAGAIELNERAPQRDADFPFWLALDPSAESWEGDPLVLACPVLQQDYTILLKDFPQGYIEINPEDARKLRLRPGAKIKLVGEKEEFVISAKISDEIPPGILLLPFGQRAVALSLLESVEDETPSLEPTKVKIEGA